MPTLNWPEILLILLVLLLLFGARRLPDAARGIGRSLRIFKAEVKSIRDDDSDAPASEASASEASEPRTTRQVNAIEASPAAATSDVPVVETVTETPVEREHPR